jgi:hypothetical protein
MPWSMTDRQESIHSAVRQTGKRLLRILGPSTTSGANQKRAVDGIFRATLETVQGTAIALG